jgi:hypothetical protein
MNEINSTHKFSVSLTDKVNLDSILDGKIHEMNVNNDVEMEPKTADGYCIECSGFFQLIQTNLR